ncbi:hypothetical protein EBU94_03945 [bacterium]|nr:hypothetical protein [bacterium]
MDTLKCPICENNLEVKGKGRHLSWIESFDLNENRVISEKSEYQCSNGECSSNKFGIFWIENGEWFRYKTNDQEVNMLEYRKFLCEKTGHPFAIGSWNHYYHVGIDLKNSKKKTIKFLNYKVDIIPADRSYNLQENKRFLPHPYLKKFRFWKKIENTDESYYVSMTFFLPMFLFCIRNFKSEAKSYLQTVYATKYEKNYAKNRVLNLLDTGYNKSNWKKYSVMFIKLFYSKTINKLTYS